MNRFLAILFSMVCSHLFAQEPPVQMQQQLEDLALTSEVEDPEDDQVLQLLEQLKKDPININIAGAEQFRQIPILTDLQIDHLVKYRKIFGNLLSVYELQAVPHWDLRTIRMVLPYIRAGSNENLKESFLSRLKGDQYILLRMSRVLERSKGYDTANNQHYLGDQNSLMFRYRYQYKDLLYFGLVGDKDAGEQFFRGTQSKGFDFYSFHFFARRLGIFRSFALGDYTINLGQGLIQWQSMGLGKSSEVMAVKRQAPVLMPYRSAGEFNFNRGVAAGFQMGRLESTVFISHKKISGNLETDSLERFTSMLTSGYYRNASEIAGRKQVAHTSYGSNIHYAGTGLRVGMNMVVNRFSIPFQKKAEPYNKYAFSGKQGFNSSVDFSYTYKNVHVFGEVAFDGGLHPAVLAGAMLSVHPKVDISLLCRHLAKEYRVLFGSAFTEGSLPVNEKGVYAGITIRPSDTWQFSAFADQSSFPWLKYRVNAPSRSHDYLFQWSYRPNKQFEVYARYRQEIKPINDDPLAVINYPLPKNRQSLRVHVQSQLNAELAFRSRVELIWYDRKGNKEEGFLAYIEGFYQGSQKWKANLRLQFFETGGYNSRIYAYESDVLYSFSIPASFDSGLRYYCNLNWKPNKKLQFWLRWSQSVYTNKKELGSGLDQIRGNRRSELKLQWLYNF